MLVIMADLLARSVGNMFVAAFFPGLLLSGLYVVYIVTLCRFKPELAPIPREDLGPDTGWGVAKMVLTSFFPPILLIFMVLGSILFGWATPTEAAGVGAAGAILLAFLNLVVLPALGIEHRPVGDEAEESRGTSGGDPAGGHLPRFGRVMWASAQRAAMTTRCCSASSSARRSSPTCSAPSAATTSSSVSWRASASAPGACCSC